jgi:hypothetical protein
MPATHERRTVIPRGRLVGDELWLPDEVRRRAAWNDKIRWTLSDLLPEEAKRPEHEGDFEIVVRYRVSDASLRAQEASKRLAQPGATGAYGPAEGD